LRQTSGHGFGGNRRLPLVLVAWRQLSHRLLHLIKVRTQVHQDLGGYTVSFPYQSEQNMLCSNVILMEVQRLSQR
jgi:hypothetical protein